MTPQGGHLELALRAALSQVIAHAGTAKALTGPLVIALDTLLLDSGDNVIAAPGASIVARRVEIAGGGQATLRIRSDSPFEGIQLTTAGIDGTLSVALETAAGTPVAGAGSGPLALDGVRALQVLSARIGSAPTSTADSQTVADTLKQPWAIVAVQLSAAIGSILFDAGSDDAIELAEAMLQWAVGGCGALLAQRSELSGVDFGNVASVHSSAVGTLARIQARASGAIYVPALSESIYRQQIDALLTVAQTYEQKIAGLEGQLAGKADLTSFAQTLGTICQQAEPPLLAALKRLANQSAELEQQLANATIQLHSVASTLQERQQQLIQAIEEQRERELVSTAVETCLTVATLYIGAAVALLGYPEGIAEQIKFDAAKATKAAMELAGELIIAGRSLDSAIAGGMDAAGTLPATANDSRAAAEGAKCLVASLASFGSAIAQLWAAVDAASASTPIDLAPKLPAVETLPDLSGMSIGGVDPVTYWNAVVVQTNAVVEALSLPEATAYREAVALAATYGAAVGDLQMKLLELYTQGMAAFDQLRQVAQGQAAWQSLQGSLAASAEQAVAAIGLLQRGYLNVKRSIVLAVENFRAAFFYQWLAPTDIAVDASMDYATLQQHANNSIEGLMHVLAGTSIGTIRGRQPFKHVTYRVEQQPLFTEVDGSAQARFTIDPCAIAEQLGGNSAVFLTKAAFELQGGSQSDAVHMVIATSSHYANQLGATSYRFVSQPFSGTNNYLPGDPPTYVSKWRFTDAASYLAPTPYTDWTVTVRSGDWQHATSIKLTLAGILLQNPSQ